MLTRSTTCPVRKRPTPAGLFRRFFRALDLRSQRRQLALLDDHLLADIGLTRAEAETEADQSGWDVPDHWIR